MLCYPNSYAPLEATDAQKQFFEGIDADQFILGNTLGIHPKNAHQYNRNVRDVIVRAYEDRHQLKFKALGEGGFDDSRG